MMIIKDARKTYSRINIIIENDNKEQIVQC